METEPAPAELRPLNSADLAQVAQVHRAAFPETLLTRLGDDVVQRYYQWQLVDGPHQVAAVGAFSHDRLQGFIVAGTFRGAVSGFVRANRGLLARRLATRPWLAASAGGRRRLRSAWRWLRPVPASPARVTGPRRFGILALAVEPGARGRGLGRLLLEAAERAALEAGTHAMHLTVRHSNLGAIAFYERLGWQKEPPAGDGTERMTKLLHPPK